MVRMGLELGDPVFCEGGGRVELPDGLSLMQGATPMDVSHGRTMF